MKQYIVSQWKVNKAIITLIIIGFFIADIVLSVGITLSRRQIERYGDMMIGDPDNQVEIEFNIKDSNVILGEIDKLKTFGEIQVVSGKIMDIQFNDIKYKAQPVPVWFERKEEWHIPIIKGRYLSVEDINQQKMAVVLGKHSAQKLGADVGASIQINGKMYQVIGIAGRSYRETQWDDAMYLPGQVFCKNNPDFFSEFTYVLLKSGKERFKNEYTISENIQYEELKNEIDTSGVGNGIILTVILSGCVFIVAIVNMSNLMLYRVLERKKTYGIIKAIGGHNGYILKMILYEVLVLTLTSSLLALGVLEIVHLFFPSLPIELTVLNIAVSVLVAFLTGVIASIVPAVHVVRMQPVIILNEGDI